MRLLFLFAAGTPLRKTALSLDTDVLCKRRKKPDGDCAAASWLTGGIPSCQAMDGGSDWRLRRRDRLAR
jgi:hypothetical protein